MSRYHFDSDPQTRKRMSNVHLKGGTDEVLLAKALWHKGIRYYKNYRKLPGSPDIAVTKYKIAVFVDGEFWHGKDWKNKKKHLHRNKDYWIKKIETNMHHDTLVTHELEERGWTVLRFWAKDVVKNPTQYAEEVVKYVEKYKHITSLPTNKKSLNPSDSDFSQ